MDIPDIELVVVNGFPATVPQWYQVSWPLYQHIKCLWPTLVRIYVCVCIADVWKSRQEWLFYKSSPSLHKHSDEAYI